jgi:hypothetical protein
MGMEVHWWLWASSAAIFQYASTPDEDIFFIALI